jgi:outer membrane biosynthesis protein TonB
VTDNPDDLLAITADLLHAAEEKENGQAIAARNDVMRAQVYALLSIARSLAQLAVNTTPPPPPAEPTPEPEPEPEPEPDQPADVPAETPAEQEPPTDAQLPD